MATLTLTRRWLLLIAAPLLALALLVACDSDDAEPTEAATAELLGEASPGSAEGQTLYLQRVTIHPDQQLPTHYHQGTQIGYIESGVLTYVIETGTARVVRADGREESFGGPITIELHEGDYIVETQDLVHYGANETDDPVVILLSSLLNEDAPLSNPTE